ncbi:putative zinc finger protein [Lyophyllum shimeji]|uniref:Zinc finger protein n=1 Tax=Lyophyllum shimeji TaxID=47721 RepID=A0A9P3PD50_LYOSH|nr:putative zinc finger protein [Lyophyllum shimeji]
MKPSAPAFNLPKLAMHLQRALYNASLLATMTSNFRGPRALGIHYFFSPQASYRYQGYQIEYSHMSYDMNEPVKDLRPPSPPQPQAHRVGFCFEQLRGEIWSMLENETFLADKIQKLEAELSVYKRAYNDVDSERKQLEKLKQDAVKEKEDLENQIKGFRVTALLDGDGAIFSGDLIAQGKTGGHTAAQKLSDSILQHLSSTYGANQYQLWVYVFLNKRGLVDTFGRVGNNMAKQKFEDFMTGFNQAAERFLMVDVGDAKEAADAKIKAHLEDQIRLPQTYKIVFGGCHDNGYVTNLRSQITAGYKQKLILLRSYTDMAAGIADLELPLLTIPDLFFTQKLVTPSPAQIALSGQVGHINSSPRVGPAAFPASVPTPLALPALDQTPGANPDPPVERENPVVPRRPSNPPTYSSAVQSTQKRVPTPDLDSSSTTSSDASDDPPERPAPTFTRARHVNPNIPLSKHKPPPCTLFYLANCKHGADCKYGHDYLLDAEHFAEIRMNAKKAPCPAINKGEPCLWGDGCCYGHYCSLSTKCHFFKQGRCKFVGADMHKEPKFVDE